jgi:hypothetical protein
METKLEKWEYKLKFCIESKNEKNIYQVLKWIQNRKSKLKEWVLDLKKITNHNYEFKYEIKNKSNFDKRTKNKFFKKIKN